MEEGIYKGERPGVEAEEEEEEEEDGEPWWWWGHGE